MSLAATLLERFKPAISQPSAMPLALALAKLEIEPFNRSSVDIYREKKKSEAMRKSLPANPAYTWIEYDPALLRKSAGPTVADPAGLLGANPAFINERDFYMREGWDVRMFVEARCCLTYMCFARWYRKNLSDHSIQAVVCRATVPEFVARKIEQVESLVPGVEIDVETLETKTRDCDPFLIVRYGKEEYYIEVWGDDEDYNKLT